MIHRRAVLSGMAIAGAVAASGASSVLAQARAPLHVQFFTFNSFTGRGWDKFSEGMEVAKSIGYDGIEFAGIWDHSPEMIRKRAEELGLSLRSYHMGNDLVRAFFVPGPGGIQDAQDAVYSPPGVVQVCRINLSVARDLGCEWGGLGAAGRSNFVNLDAIRRLAEAYNTCGELADQAGIKFFVHSHALFFRPVEGRIPLDIVAEETGPAVRFQFCTGHAAAEGQDPGALIRKYADRIDSLHLRDSVSPGVTAAPGDGVIDFASVMTSAQALANPVVIMEGNGRPEPEAIAEATRAYRHLNPLGLGLRQV